MSSYLSVWLMNFSAQGPAFWAVLYLQCIYKATTLSLFLKENKLYLSGIF